MTQRCTYTADDDVASMWQKFACNIMILHDPTGGRGLAELMATQPQLPLSYLENLYRFRPISYIQKLTHRLNGIMVADSRSTVWGQPSNTTWMYIPEQRRRAGEKLERSTVALINHLRTAHGIQLNTHPAWTGWHDPPAGEHTSLTLAVQPLQRALQRLHITHGIDTYLPRVYVLTVQRVGLLAALPVTPAHDPQLAKLFTTVEQDLSALL